MIERSGMIGETVDGRYLVEALLSSGSSGTVYLAAEISSDEPVAIKFIESLDEVDLGTLPKDLERKFGAITAMNSMGFVRVYGYGLYRGVPFLVSAYPDGMPLSNEIELAPLSMERVVHICYEIGQLLSELHEYGIIHGDLWPVNVILTPTRDLPYVKLAGFGSTWAQDLRERESEDLAYLAPEQIQGRQPDVRSDLYSLGGILYALSTGHLPSQVPDIFKTSPAPSQLNPKIPSSMEKLILELLDTNPDIRPRDAELVVARLQQIGQNDLFQPGENATIDEPQIQVLPVGNYKLPSISLLKTASTLFYDISCRDIHRRSSPIPMF